MKTRHWVWIAALPAALLPSLELEACPDCAEGIRKQVHTAIFDETFARNLVMAALPFGVLAGITAAIHFGLPGRRR